MGRCLFCFLVLTIIDGLHAQNKYHFVEVSYLQGISEPYHRIPSLQDGFRSFDVKFGWQSQNPDSWVSMYNFPAYGIGFQKLYVGAPEVVGNPNALYGFIHFQLNKPKPNQRLKLFFSPAFGVGFGLIPFDSIENPDNYLASTSAALYVKFALFGSIRLTEYLDLTYGLAGSHISNGRTSQPNLGVNNFGGNIGLQYHLNGHPTNLETQKATKLREHSINLVESVAFIQYWDDKETNKRQFANIMRLDYRYKFNIKHGLTAGLDWFYDTSLESYFPGDVSHYGVHLGYDYMFWVFGMRMMFGTYLGDNKNKHPVFGRLELQYELSPTFQFQMGIKSNAPFEADWLEFGFSIRPFCWSKKT